MSSWMGAEQVPLTWWRVLTAWRSQPAVVATVVALGAGYGWGLVRWRHRPDRGGGRAWPAARTASFLAGVASLGVAGLSFIGVYANTLFWARAVQNIVLLMVTPMLLALGAPITLARDLLPVRWRVRLSRWGHSGPARLCSHPLVVTLLLVVPLLALYLSPLYELTLRSPVASGLTGLVVCAAGFAYFWTRFQIDPTPRRGSHGVTLAITVVEMIGDAVLGVVLWLGPLVAADYYTALHRDWGPSPSTDQLLGAGVLWIGGDVVGLPFILIVVSRMIREDETHAAAIDAELDALERATTAPSPAPDEPAGADATADPSRAPARLWWQDDPQLADRFRPRP